MVKIVPSPDIAGCSATAATIAFPHPANVAAPNVSVPLAVNIGSCRPLALTDAESEPPEVVGSEKPPRLAIDKEPFIVQLPVQYMKIPRPG
jgi:hypothetical protein